MTDSDRTTATTILDHITADLVVVEDLYVIDPEATDGAADTVLVRIASRDGTIAVHMWATLQDHSRIATKIRNEIRRIRRNRRAVAQGAYEVTPEGNRLPPGAIRVVAEPSIPAEQWTGPDGDEAA
jgi:hypothetical protein